MIKPSLKAKRPHSLDFSDSIFSPVAGSFTRIPSVRSLLLEKNRFTVEASTNPKYGVDSNKAFPKNPGSWNFRRSFRRPTLPMIALETANTYAAKNLAATHQSNDLLPSSFKSITFEALAFETFTPKFTVWFRD